MSIRTQHFLLHIAFILYASLCVACAPVGIYAESLKSEPTIAAEKHYRHLPLVGNERPPVPVAIAIGELHTCALSSSGGVKCWGFNLLGQLGDNTTGDPSKLRLVPVDAKNLISGVKAVTAGRFHSCALTTAGGVKCWGYNEFGQLGNGGVSIPCGSNNVNHCMLVPVNVAGLSSGVQAIDSSYYYTCALTEEGGVKCWGHNNTGQLGNGSGGTWDDRSLVPVDVVGLSSGVKAISVGVEHTCALLETGGVKCWGLNHLGQLGDGGGGDPCDPEGRFACRLTPVEVNGLSSNVQAIAVGGGHTCVLTTASAVKCWGENNLGQLGDGTRINRSTPVPVVGMSDGAQAIAAGMGYTCALTIAGSVKCWGYNVYGALGDGGGGSPCGYEDGDPCRLEPVNVIGLESNVAAIIAGINHTCALTRSGVAKCWGANDYGQVGDRTQIRALTPVEVVWP